MSTAESAKGEKEMMLTDYISLLKVNREEILKGKAQTAVNLSQSLTVGGIPLLTQHGGKPLVKYVVVVAALHIPLVVDLTRGVEVECFTSRVYIAVLPFLLLLMSFVYTCMKSEKPVHLIQHIYYNQSV